MKSSVDDKMYRLRALSAQIQHIDQLLAQGVHAAAGLEVTLNVGTQRGVDPDLTLEIVHDTPELLQVLRSSLQKSKDQYEAWLREDMRQMESLLSGQTDPSSRPRG